MTAPSPHVFSPPPMHHVWLLAYAQCMSLDITGPMQVFASANDVRALQGLPPYYVVALAATTPGLVRMSCGLQVMAPSALQQVTTGAHTTVLVPGGDGVDQAQHDPQLRQWLQHIAPQVQRLGSVCSGALILAQAGLLHGQRATTHWSRAPALSAVHPSITVDADCLHTFDAQHPQRSRLFTSAGVTAGIDLALALVEADLGAATALAVARQLVMFVRRPGGQAQFSPLLCPDPAHTPRLAQLLQWLPSQLGTKLHIDALATQACLPPRTLARVFQQELGTTPGRYVEQLRVQTACTLLSQRKASVATVARLCGFGHAENLRRSFHKHLGISPAEFAQRFASGPALAPA